MDLLKEIDDQISNQLSSLDKIVNELKFNEICQFKIQNEIKEIPWDDIVYSGVYLIEIKNNKKFISFKSWVGAFEKEWENEKYHKKFVPNVKKKRVDKHTELN